MLLTTKAIVLYYTKYSESSLIVHLFAESIGRISVIVYGVKGKKQSKLVSFQSLYLLDCVIDFKANRNVQVLKEHKINPPLINITSNIGKSTIAMFIAEILFKCLREESADEQLFSFVSTSIKVLNEMEKGVGLFHLAFLIKLSRYLGFGPDENLSGYNYYDLKTGRGLLAKPPHDFGLQIDLYKKLIDIYKVGFNELEAINITFHEREQLLQAIIQLYEIHAINFNTLKSFSVLKEVFG